MHCDAVSAAIVQLLTLRQGRVSYAYYIKVQHTGLPEPFIARPERLRSIIADNGLQFIYIDSFDVRFLDSEWLSFFGCLVFAVTIIPTLHFSFVNLTAKAKIPIIKTRQLP